MNASSGSATPDELPRKVAAVVETTEPEPHIPCLTADERCAQELKHALEVRDKLQKQLSDACRSYGENRNELVLRYQTELQAANVQLTYRQRTKQLHTLIDQSADSLVSSAALLVMLKRAAMIHAKQGRSVDYRRFMQLSRPVVSVRQLHGFANWCDFYRLTGPSSLLMMGPMRAAQIRSLTRFGFNRLLKLLRPHTKQNETLLRSLTEFNKPKIKYRLVHWSGWCKDHRITLRLREKSERHYWSCQVQMVRHTAHTVSVQKRQLERLLNRWQTAEVRTRWQHWEFLSKLPRVLPVMRELVNGICGKAVIHKGFAPWRRGAAQSRELARRDALRSGTWPHVHTVRGAWRDMKTLAAVASLVRHVRRNLIHQDISRGWRRWELLMQYNKNLVIFKWACSRLANLRIVPAWNALRAHRLESHLDQQLRHTAREFRQQKALAALKKNRLRANQQGKRLQFGADGWRLLGMKRGYLFISEWADLVRETFVKIRRISYKFLSKDIQTLWLRWTMWTRSQTYAKPIIAKARARILHMALIDGWKSLREAYARLIARKTLPLKKTEVSCAIPEPGAQAAAVKPKPPKVVPGRRARGVTRQRRVAPPAAARNPNLDRPLGQQGLEQSFGDSTAPWATKFEPPRPSTSRPAPRPRPAALTSPKSFCEPSRRHPSRAGRAGRAGGCHSITEWLMKQQLDHQNEAMPFSSRAADSRPGTATRPGTVLFGLNTPGTEGSRAAQQLRSQGSSTSVRFPPPQRIRRVETAPAGASRPRQLRDATAAAREAAHSEGNTPWAIAAAGESISIHQLPPLSDPFWFGAW